jgi:hypothetical protein
VGVAGGILIRDQRISFCGVIKSDERHGKGVGRRRRARV